MTPAVGPARAVLLGAAACAALLAVAGPGGLAHLLPAVILAVLLATDRYPGARRLARTRRERRPPRRGAPRQAAPRAPAAWAPRGGLLIARGLAVRPPPSATPLSA
ncbi:MAG: hypothetical protein QOD86_2433 [Miltoncostaeaceae bacterium]|nr:hypothetical protein [Miltoncostaeaceae bacterium]